MPSPRLRDSSKTRVVPVFQAISTTGPDWVHRLLALPNNGAPGVSMPLDLDLAVQEQRWGAEERSLAAPPSLLAWLIRNLQRAPAPSDLSEVAGKRRSLVNRDPSTIEEALDLLRTRSSGRGWHILEGHTYPDVFLTTPDAVVVIEGKRTEAGPTTSTTWMPGRHQMLRHMDAAWEIRGSRRVYGFFIVEAEPGSLDVPSAWIAAARSTLSPTAIQQSLPHRSNDEQKQLAEGFLGVTTWQAVCAAFDLDASYLPETVASTGGKPAL